MSAEDHAAMGLYFKRRPSCSTSHMDWRVADWKRFRPDIHASNGSSERARGSYFAEVAASIWIDFARRPSGSSVAMSSSEGRIRLRLVKPRRCFSVST